MNNTETKEKILEKIKEYQKIIISRHIRPDGDAVGSTKGLYTFIKDNFPKKTVLLINDDYAEYTAFMGGEDGQIAEDEYSDALVIVLDTATADRISNGKYSFGKEIIKIDHHIDEKPYGDISWVEDERSSACEMVADFCLSFGDALSLSCEAATYLYTGMVTDSGRFRYSSTSGETLRIAGALLDRGIETDKLFANLYLDDYENLKYKSYVLHSMKRTENGVAYIYITRAARKKLGISLETASAAVSMLDSIRGSLIWLAFIETDDSDKSIRVRLRSRFATVQQLATHYHGGGHLCASGATVYSRKEAKALLREADALLKEYKSSNEGWL